MKKDKLYQVLVSPVVSEKSTVVAERDNQVVFKVIPTATRVQVKAAVEQAFEVEVASVNILNVKGKTKRSARGMGKRKDVKKAYIRLKEGSDIDFTAFQA